MADDDEATLSGALPTPPPSEPDTSNSPTLVQRRDTISSKAASVDGSGNVDTCRICRSEGSPDEPLFYPCKCSGSIKFVHQECLMEWLSHSHKKHCELCKTPFRFTKLYDANMPQKLPWRVFAKRACWHVVQLTGRGGRSLLVAFVWLGLIPWLIRWVWRWFFWVADAAWARETIMDMVDSKSTEQKDIQTIKDLLLSGEMRNVEWMTNALKSMFDYDALKSLSQSNGTIVSDLANALSSKFGYSSDDSTSIPASNVTRTDVSVLSSWNYLSSLTPDARINRIILDVFEGQIITCVVIVGFILVFLIREWVVQQQPLVNIDNLGNMQQQLREAAERVEADNERLRRQQELLEQARRRLVELHNETEARVAMADDVSEANKAAFVGWQELEQLIDRATEHLRSEAEDRRELFLSSAEQVTKQIRAAGMAGVDLNEFTDKVYRKLASYSDQERKEWEGVLVSQIEKTLAEKKSRIEANLNSLEEAGGEAGDAEVLDSTQTRPPMRERDSTSQAANIQRLLQETDTNIRASQDAVKGASLNTSLESQTNTAESTEQLQEIRHSFEPMPITNAGPDAKINIKLSGSGKWKAIPEPKIEEKMLADDEKKRKLEAEVKKELEEEITKASDEESQQPALAEEDRKVTASENNPFHPDGPEPERRNSESFGNRVASVFREEFGLDEAEELESLRRAGVGPDGEATQEDEHPEESAPQQPDDAPPSRLRRLADWLWGDIQPQAAPEPDPMPDEEIQQVNGGNDGQEAPFVPVREGQPDVGNVVPPQPEQQQHHDPEVVAAAQQAGLDPEAAEDAEDLEGILELIGVQGPLIGLFQTSAFCTLLVACTILCAVVLPYFGGKIVLNLLGNPVYFLIKMPLAAASGIADMVIDLALMAGGWLVMLAAFAIERLLLLASMWLPRLSGFVLPIAKVIIYSKATVKASCARFLSLFVTTEAVEGPTVEILAISFAFLGGSAHAHASLKTIQHEINAVLSFMGAVVTWIVETISSGSVSTVLMQAFHGLTQVSFSPAKLKTAMSVVQGRAQPIINFFWDLKRGALTVSSPQITLERELVYWNSTDRALAIMTGYMALAALAAVYVAADTPITKSESGRKTEKLIRDTLRQAGGVLKVILIISIEMLVFPLYCGLLLDIAFLPLFKNASLAIRWEFAVRSPNTFCFVHWFVGTCYMFHFALFVGMCRKILRKGVLWFIRDPDDPTFHPVRDVLERNVATQLRKIAFSALVYGALVILCLGGVIWAIGQVFDDVFPIHWISTEPILEFPMDLLLYNFVTPLIFRLFKPSDAVNTMYAWWLRRCARGLRLSHFLFDDRRKDEEGHFVRKSWIDFLLFRRADREPNHVSKDSNSSGDDAKADTGFKRDGKYVLTPCNDQYRPPKPGEAFLHADDDDVYIVDKEGKKNDHFSKVYVPPFFRLRISAFMVCLWIFSAFTGLCTTIVPLIFGRRLFESIMPTGMIVNDIYAYSSGAYILGGVMYLLMKSRAGARYFKERTANVDINAWIEPAKRFSIRALKCVYFYGFTGVVLPSIFAVLLQFYIIVPLHTYVVTAATSPPPVTTDSDASNATLPFTTPNAQLSPIAEHTIHILQDYALGLVYLRIAGRLLIAAPASRAAEAFRRITADGYLNPNVRLATRFFVLPVTFIAAMLLLLPPLTVSITLAGIKAVTSSLTLDVESETKLCRYSYPLAASCIVFAFGGLELGKATSRWRSRIRDEVYLVGERLHNFGEKKPPIGSKSVVRKEK